MQYTFDIAHPSSGGLPVNRPDLSTLIRRQMMNGPRAGRPGALKPLGTSAAPPPSQWTFQPNPRDQAPAGQPSVAPGNAGQAQGQNPWAFSPPIQPWMFNPMGGGWGQWGGWQDPGFSQQPPGMPPQTGGGLPPYQPQTGGQLPPYSGNIFSNTVPTVQPSSPYSGQPWQHIKPY